MKVITQLNELKKIRNEYNQFKIGLVPTMGNLHEGHISLLKSSIEENDYTFFTIFVNPKQFGPNEDFNKYPRTLQADLEKIQNATLTSEKIVVFAPKTTEEVFPMGFTTSIKVSGITELLEGSIRPNHFEGVTTVVYRLFQLIQPHTSYFGQKDYQQCLVIKKMVADLELNIKIKMMPIIREESGLALSSRNQYLNESEKIEALILSQTLIKLQDLILKNENFDWFCKEVLKNSKWEYLQVLDAETLLPHTEFTKQFVLIGVYKINQTRLLDNRLVTKT